VSELFKSSEVEHPSPRLIWLAAHNLAIGQLPDGTRFCAAIDRVTTGDTHKDCELKMATELEIEHWSLEDARKAGISMPEKVTTEVWD